ncbi:MAG: TonB-dependent receptor, partial [Blastocatellia bacterium]|nr:TonB-dependent receptor [Blastocatellia bacterium]
MSGVERPSLARDVFGGSIGGPIVKDKLFFFYNFEGQRENSAVSVVRTVPLAHLGRGELRFNGTLPTDPAGTPSRLLTLNTAQLNAIYPDVGINSAAVAALRDAATRYASNDTSVGDGLNTGGFRFNTPTAIEENTHILKLDYNLTSNQSIFVRGNYQYDIRQGTSQFPDTPSTSLWDHPIGFVVGHNWTIGNNKVNNFRYGLTRQSFSNQGDSSANSINFRFVFSPLLYQRTLSRVTPTQNFTDDFTWVKGNHTIQFGGNVRIIRNQRTDFANAFDTAVTNPSFYDQSGAVIDGAIFDAGYFIEGGDISSVQAAATALIGRFSQYSGNFTFDRDGSVLTAGSPTDRNFATEEYDFYVQDAWKPFNNLTLTLGLRYGLSRPVYEKNGFQVVPTEPLGDFFERRKASAATGVPLNDLISFERAGPANNGPGFYSLDKNNFQPRVAVAWSPNFESGFLKAIFGGENKSTIRGGFAITNDYFGQQLAVSFDGLSTIGFTSSSAIAANTFGITAADRAPQFTGFNQNIRALPGIPAPTQRFATEATPGCLAGTERCPQRIESSLDATIVSPQHYTWNVSWGRSLPKQMYFEASYVGRQARNLLATQDVMALNNIVDPRSGQDWYTAAGILHDLRARNTPVDQVPVIPFFANLFPNYTTATRNSTQRVYNLVNRAGSDILDWTFVQLLIDDRGIVPNIFFHPQYAAFSAFSSIASSDYHGASFSLRQRLGDVLTYDINYTFSKSLDNASGLQTGGSYGSQFILNPLRPEDNRSFSDFDTRHIINANFLAQLPIGKGKQFFGNMNGFLDALVGGWQLSGIYRYNSGLPTSAPFDQAQWATNWNVQSNGTPVGFVNFGAIRDTQN